MTNDKENALNTCQTQDRLKQLELSVGLYKCEHSEKLQKAEIPTTGMVCEASAQFISTCIWGTELSSFAYF